MIHSLEDYILIGAKEMGLPIKEETILKCRQYYNLIIEENQKYNLTAIIEEKEAAIKHFLDSFSLLLVQKMENLLVLDLGTGAGFPGIPLALEENNFKIILTDSVKKKVNFVSKASEELNLDWVNTLHMRSEDMGQNPVYRAKFDLVVSRAVASLPTLLEYALPLLKTNGSLLAMKGPQVFEEINKAKVALEKLGGKIISCQEISLPFIQDKRTIVKIEKIKPTPKEFPRKAGTPTKKPL